MKKPALRLSLAGITAAIAALAPFAAAAQADTVPRIPFFACAYNTAIGNAAAPSRHVLANQPLWFSSPWASGTRGLVVAARGKVQNTFDVTYSSGGRATFHPTYGPVVESTLGDGTWGSFLTRIEFGSLQPGETMTIHWTYIASAPIEDIAPPSIDWLPTLEDNGYLWDGTGLKYQNHIDAGLHDNGICTVTADA